MLDVKFATKKNGFVLYVIVEYVFVKNALMIGGYIMIICVTIVLILRKKKKNKN